MFDAGGKKRGEAGGQSKGKKNDMRIAKERKKCSAVKKKKGVFQ